MQSPTFLESHPWLTFHHTAELSQLWMLIGEAFSKCQHLAGTPLQPSVATSLASVYLIKGAVASTAIEGNTLSAADYQQIQQGEKKLGTSQQYLQQEIDNVVHALELIDISASKGNHFKLTTAWIKTQNELVLQNLELDDHVVPGQYATDQLMVGGGIYRPPAPQYAAQLMEDLCSWLNADWIRTPEEEPDAGLRFARAFHAAVLAHVYIAWIHPFGDGNGRTARLVECAILAHSAVVPWVSANLLSDHYNRTRDHYYRHLRDASGKGDVVGFIKYSAQGFVDLIREQIDEVRKMQRRVSWINYVHEVMDRLPSDRSTRVRQRDLALELYALGEVRISSLADATMVLARNYANRTTRTISRDVRFLATHGLAITDGRHVRSNAEVLDAFLPIADAWGPSRQK